jgi:hypothetical protein
MKQIFLHIQSIIASKVNTPTLESIRFFDFDLGQLDEETPPVSFPCLLLSFGNTTWEQIGKYENLGDTSINLRIAFKTYERTHSKNDPTYQEQGLKHLDTLSLLKKSIAFTKGNDFSELLITGESNETRADLRVYNLTFSTTITENYQDNQIDPFVPWQDLQPPFPNPNGPDFCIHP